MSGVAPGARPRGRAAAGAALLLLLLLYAALIHHGVGPSPGVAAPAWWQPRGFLLGSELLGLFGEGAWGAILGLAAPAALLAVGVFAAVRSALARCLALAALLATALFLFYGLREPGPRIWSFFLWRSTVVMLLTALVAAAAAAAPLLAGSWLRLPWAARLALYLPIIAVVVAAERSTTGTDPELAFAVSPWPVVTIFGLQIAAGLLAGLLACAALVLAALAHRRRHPLACAVGVLAALGLPAAWAGLDLGGGIPLLLAALAAAAAALGLRAAAAADWVAALRSPAGHVALGAALVAAPILIGANWVQLDYRVTRERRAQVIIDALHAYYEREGLYPEDLSELVAARDLGSVPQPQIGFRLLGAAEFTYQNFGTDYLLEFAAPGWVQCAYSPPWEPDEPEGSEIFAGEDDVAAGGSGEAGDGAGESLPGVWSCPAKSPELW